MDRTAQLAKWLVAGGVLFLCGPIADLRADTPAADPIEWNAPAAAPEFRLVLDNDEYQKRFDAAWKDVGPLETLEASRTPSAGQKIMNVTPGTPAELLGIHVGDVLTHCNGDYMWTEKALDRDFDEERAIHLVTPHGVERTVTVPPGKIGFNRTSIWHPELEYLRSQQQNSKWDRDVVIGLTMAAKDPDLAETCWARAIEAGYVPDNRSAIFGAYIALNAGRSEVAADFAYPLREIGFDESVHPEILILVALANYKLKHALHLASRMTAVFDPERVTLWKQLVELHEGRPLEKRCLPPPNQLADAMYRDEFRKEAVSTEDHPREFERRRL